MSEPGLRERKRQRMYQVLSDTAIRLFLEKGFDAVSVAEVAAAAEVSKPTLFRYFPAKEDLVLYRIADHEREAARQRVDPEDRAGAALVRVPRRRLAPGAARGDRRRTAR
jgi:AcrR family transcriptional regulator